MKLNIYSLFDKKAATFHQPFYSTHDGVAQRMVAASAADVNSSLGQFPSDYSLYRIGTFDDQNAEVQAEIPPSHICEVVALVKGDTAQVSLFHKEA